MNKLRPGQIRRLVMYYHYLRDNPDLSTRGSISSGELADIIDVDDTQVRKDFAAIGVRGQPRIGFDAKEISIAIRSALHLDHVCDAIIVGAGRLGGAIASYPDFNHYGLKIKAIFDADEKKVGTRIAGLKVNSIINLESEMKRIQAMVGILSVPAVAAQEIADRLVRAGIRAIWNFAPTQVIVPERIRLVNVHLSASLAELCYCVRCKCKGE